MAAPGIFKDDPNLTPCKPNDIYIAIMGVTGAGKSSLIEKCCPHSTEIVGEDLDSYTKDCRKHTLVCKGKIVHLIDTPGFNDSTRQDTDVLIQVATWLGEAYKSKTHLNGLVYLHGINTSRMTGTDRVHLNMFQDLTGSANMKNVVLATSFWDSTPPDKAKAREAMLVKADNFWKIMKENGANVMQFKNDEVSAMAIIEYIVDLEKTTLEIQREMSEEKKTVRQTAAGLTLDNEINKKVEDATKDLRDIQADLEKAIKDKDDAAVRMAAEQEEKMKEHMKELEENKRALDKTTEELLKQKNEEIRRSQEELVRVRTENERQKEEHDRRMAQKDEEKEQELRKNDQAWSDAVDDAATQLGERLSLYLRAQESEMASVRQAPQQQSMSEERVELLFRRLMMEKMEKEAEQKNNQPPPYSAHAPIQQPPPGQNMHPSQSMDTSTTAAIAGGVTAAGIGLGSLAAATMCNVM